MAGRSLISELVGYAKAEKKWWLIPLLLLLLVAGSLLLFAQGSALAPLIYTIF